MTSRTSSTEKKPPLTIPPLTPVAMVIHTDSGKHFLKVRCVTPSGDRVAQIPLSTAYNDRALKKFAADYFGLPEKDCPSVESLKAVSESLPRITGVTRLGWTEQAEALLYGAQVLSAQPVAQGRYELLAPKGTLHREAAEAFTPHGSREEQYQGFRELWSRSDEFKLVLALASVSPFLEIMGTPTLVFHLAGRTGVGKTTLFRLGVSIFADPSSSTTYVDFSKDTPNYADERLGLLHNFPILIDETTLCDVHVLAQAAYNIAFGRTKGRLTGPEHGYAPVDTASYSLVCFLSGEVSIRERIEQRGASARFAELLVDAELVPKSELPRWYDFASEHYGWFGRDLLERQLKLHFSDGTPGAQLTWAYRGYRELTGRWCSDHSRVLDFLAALQVGYRMASAQLGADSSHRAAREFAERIYARLNKTTKLDRVLDGIAALPDIREWIERGYIPRPKLDDLLKEFEFRTPKALLDFLKAHGMATKIEARKIKGAVWQVDSGTRPDSVWADGAQRCYILTTEGRARLSALTPEV